MTHDVVSAPLHGNYTVFLSGPAGSGKTSLSVQRLIYLLRAGLPAEQLLVLVPQRTQANPYLAAFNRQDLPPGGQVDLATIGGLARRAIDLFWPLVAAAAGFSDPAQRPRFLTLETAQYHMDRIAEPYIQRGAFEGITVPRARLVSQLIDNLNKAAAVGFPPEEIAERLKSAWGGESARLRIYDQVQAVALDFRRTCLAHRLLDWSLQLQVFWQHLLPLPLVRRYLLGGYRHLIIDNIEEDIPATHDLIRLWLPLCETALLVHDTDGGYRVFLGADPVGALSLAPLCRVRTSLDASLVASPQVTAVGRELATAPGAARPQHTADPRAALVVPSEPPRFHPDMLDWVAAQASRLVLDEGLAPGEIAILAPFLSDALRFSLTERLHRFGLTVRTHRPSRPLHEEPAARCLLALAKLAHPAWKRPPLAVDVAQAFTTAISDLDPVRARLLVDIVYRVQHGTPTLTPFHQIIPETQERISYLLGGRYDELWRWLRQYQAEPSTAPLDIFLGRLFGELLSQAGFGFHHDLDAGAVAGTLVESAAKFRRGFVASPGDAMEMGPAPAYVDLIEHGVIAAQYVATWRVRPENAILLVPAYTFLMTNQPVSVQIWLDAGSPAWAERIYQPLTHPYVLRRDWPQGRTWTDGDEVQARQQTLSHLVLGLCRRCRSRIYLAFSELNERGYEQQGPLLQAVQELLRRHSQGAP